MYLVDIKYLGVRQPGHIDFHPTVEPLSLFIMTHEDPRVATANLALPAQ
jgi:hypothetical protein